jgi:hypothetical protein
MHMYLILFTLDAWDKVSTVFIICFGFWGFQTIVSLNLWIHLINCSSIQCQLQSVYFITLYQRSVTPYCQIHFITLYQRSVTPYCQIRSIWFITLKHRFVIPIEWFMVLTKRTSFSIAMRVCILGFQTNPRFGVVGVEMLSSSIDATVCFKQFIKNVCIKASDFVP